MKKCVKNLLFEVDFKLELPQRLYKSNTLKITGVRSKDVILAVELKGPNYLRTYVLIWLSVSLSTAGQSKKECLNSSVINHNLNLTNKQ